MSSLFIMCIDLLGRPAAPPLLKLDSNPRLSLFGKIDDYPRLRTLRLLIISAALTFTC